MLKGIRSSVQGLVRTLSTLEALNNTLIVTKSCAKRIQALQATASQPDLRLRISVEGGGCSGFQYKFEMDAEELEEDDMIFQRDGCEVVDDF